jgi:hypothetical protein
MTDPNRYLPPTDAELRILQVLWRQGTATAREVHDVLSGRAATRPRAPTSTAAGMRRGVARAIAPMPTVRVASASVAGLLATA